MAHPEPMDASFDQDDLFDEEDMVEVESDDGDTAWFLNHEAIPSKVIPMPAPESE